MTSGKALRLVLVLCLLPYSVSASVADAINSLTSFWEMNIDRNDRIAWDYRGSAHGMYVGLGLQLPGTIFGGGFSRAPGNQNSPGVGNHNSGTMAVPGRLVDTTGNSWCYAVWVRRSATTTDPIINQWSADSAADSWLVNFSHANVHATLTYAMTDGSQDSIADAATAVNPGDLALVWVAFNRITGEVNIATNADTWVTATPAQPFQGPSSACTGALLDPFPCPLNFSQINSQFFPAGSPVIGRTMFWNGYIPTDAEKTAIYNSGAGRDASYFGFTLAHPARPLSVTLINPTFADDTAFVETDQGLYWLRPFPLKFWSPALAAARGNYIWTRSSDHAHEGVGFPDGNVQIGYSSSPEILPTSWTRLSLTFADVHPWDDTETGWLVYDPPSAKFFLYGNSERTDISGPVRQATHVWTADDPNGPWTWRGLFPPDCCVTHTYNHTGYAQVVRNAPGDWTAQSLLDSSEPGTDGKVRLGLWTSPDGIAWTLVRETQMMDTFYPYRNQQNQFPVADTNNPSPPGAQAINRNYISIGATQFELRYPLFPLFFHDGDASCVVHGGINNITCNQLQDVRSYEENGTVWLYAKWSFREPSTVRLYRGSYPTPNGPKVSMGGVSAH